MRAALTLLIWAGLAAAQSHPSWWTYASPDATALVGIDWQAVRATPFADAVEAELWGDLGFPELACLHHARQIVVSAPDLLALATGNFSATALRGQAANKSFKAMTYRGIDMWFSTDKAVLSIARMNDQFLLLGDPKTLQLAVDRSLTDAKDYSPLLARAAKFAQKDLWVVASHLPDDLANRFVPLDTQAESFEGSLSVRNGLEMDAVLAANSPNEATASADKLRRAVPTLPAIARGLQVTVEEDSVMLALEATREEVIAALRAPEPVAKPPETIKVESPLHVQQVVVEKVEQIPEKPVEQSVEKPFEKVPVKPQVIRIVGLDDGPREIILPPTRPDKPRP